MKVGHVMGWAAGLLAVACLVVPVQASAGGTGAGGATKAASGQEKPEEIFKTVCANCHGPKGHGDGPAGMAFNPHPADFADPAFWKTHTDSVMVQSITNGKGMMPPFGGTYDQATIKGLVAYIHVLVGEKPGGLQPPATTTAR